MVSSRQQQRRSLLLLSILHGVCIIQPVAGFESSFPVDERRQRTILTRSKYKDLIQSKHSEWFRDTTATSTTTTTTTSLWVASSSSSSSADAAAVDDDTETTTSSTSTTTLPFVNLKKLEKTIVHLGRRGKIHQALDTYYGVGQPTVRLMNGIIDACSRARPPRVSNAFEIFQEGVTQYGIVPNVFTFGALMNVCSRAQDSDKALRLLRSMQNDYGVAPNAIVYSSAISACARSTPPKPEKALDLLREVVEDKQLQMSVVGFNAAISACARAGDWKNAISILSRMEEATSKKRQEQQRLLDEQDPLTTTTTTTTTSNNDEIKNTTTTAVPFSVPEPDAVTYGTVLAACEHGEQWSLVLKHAQSMQDMGLPLDGLSVTSCLHACQQLGLAEVALHYLEMMKSLAIAAEPQTGKLQRYDARAPLVGPDEVAYRLAISACARGGKWKDGIRLLNEFEDVTGTPPDVVAYTSAITGCEYAGMWRESFVLLDQMRKQGVEPNEVTMAAVLGACATACARSNASTKELDETPEPHKKAMELLEIMKRNDKIVSPNIQVYNSAIRACAESSDLEGALKLLDEIEENEIERTEVTYGCLMTACERVGCVDSASKVFRKMRDDGISPNEIIYGAAISCCRKAKQSERVFLLLKKMIKEGLKPNAATFNTVILSQFEGGSRADSERAILVYKLMKSKYADDAGRPDRQTYNILIKFFASIKQPLTADAFLDKMRAAGFKPDVDLFTATVAAYERTGQPLKALQLMESMEADGYDFYGVGVLNTAFKNAVKIANKVGQKLASSEEERKAEKRSLKLMSLEEDEDEEEDL